MTLTEHKRKQFIVASCVIERAHFYCVNILLTNLHWVHWYAMRYKHFMQ